MAITWKTNPATGGMEKYDTTKKQFLGNPSANPVQPIQSPLNRPPTTSPTPAPSPYAPQSPATLPPLAQPGQQPQVSPPLSVPSMQPTSGAFGAFDPNAFGGDGKKIAMGATDYLKKLRAALDAGQISVSDFLSLGQPAAQTAYQNIHQIAQSGSQGADFVKPLLAQFNQAGFKVNDDQTIAPTLPSKYNQEALKTLVPTGTTPEEFQQFVNQLPPGIDPFSDQGKIEIEKLRQQSQANQALKQQQALRDQAITGKGGLQDIIGQQQQIRNQGISSLGQQLGSEADRQFSLDQPGIYEDLNARGLLRSSALGDALARQKSIYAGDIANRLGQAQLANTQQGAADLSQLSAARLASTDADVQAIQQNLLGSNQLQQSGLSRQFGLSDFQTQAMLAREIAAQQAAASGGGGGNGLAGALSGGLQGAGIGAQFGPGSALIGGLAGAGAGYGASRGGGK